MKSYSQAGQDLWVHDLIGDIGFFVDIGAHDGIVHSNTYGLEQMGWTGICVEPDVACRDLVDNRLCYVYRMAMSDHVGDTTIYPSNRVVPCDTLVATLERFDAPDTIDFLSIDVEGHELEVLAGMDFDRWKVRLITIEHNLYCDGPARKNAIHDILIGHGFERMVEDVVAEGYGPYEDWYANVD